jgi:hypothetical protein
MLAARGGFIDAARQAARQARRLAAIAGCFGNSRCNSSDRISTR